MKKLFLALLLAVFTLSTYSCRETTDSETVIEDADSDFDQAGEEIEDGFEEVGDEMDEAGDELDEEVDVDVNTDDGI